MNSIKFLSQAVKENSECFHSIECLVNNYLSEDNPALIKDINDAIKEGYKNIENIYNEEFVQYGRKRSKKILDAIKREGIDNTKNDYYRRKCFILMVESQKHAEYIINYGINHYNYDKYKAKKEKVNNGYRFWILLEFKGKIVLNDNFVIIGLYDFKSNSKESYMDFIKKIEGEEFLI